MKKITAENILLFIYKFSTMFVYVQRFVGLIMQSETEEESW